MAVKDRGNIRRLTVALLTGVAVCALSLTSPVVHAQSLSVPGSGSAAMPEDAKLLLAANELLYDRDAERVVASGAVQINYNGYQMVARKVVYDQKTGRVTADGNIELVEPTGNRIYADSLDVTDNFSDGFLRTLRVETNDNTRLVAETAQRVGGTQMILSKGVYTACLPCADNPSRPPIWQIKAERVIQDGKKHTVRLEKARFELFGHSLATLPFIEVPDNTVKRKSGFLFPEFRSGENVGFARLILLHPANDDIRPFHPVNGQGQVFNPRGNALHGGRITGSDRLVIGPIGKRLALHCLFRSRDMGRDVSTAGV